MQPWGPALVLMEQRVGPVWLRPLLINALSADNNNYNYNCNDNCLGAARAAEDVDAALGGEG